MNAPLTSPRTKTKQLWVLLIVGVLFAGIWQYMEHAATGIEADLQYPYAMRTARPDLDKVFVSTDASSFDLIEESSKREYSDAEKQKLVNKAASIGETFSVPTGSRVLIVERHFGSDRAKVKIAAGPSAGKVGWVKADYIKVPFWSALSF